MTTIHPSAIVSPNAQLGTGVTVGPGVIIGDGCEVGDACVLEPRSVLERNVRLAAGVRVGIGTVLGGDPQDLKFQGEETWVEIGEGTRIREYTTINRGTSQSFRTTVGGTLFVFDEPTTGLHFHDIKKLLDAFSALINQGNTVIVIEHNLEVVKSADWIIDLGPEGGDEGGQLLFEGVPEDLVNCKDSITEKYLKEKL